MDKIKRQTNKKLYELKKTNCQQRTVLKKQVNFTSFLTSTLLLPSSNINPDFVFLMKYSPIITCSF